MPGPLDLILHLEPTLAARLATSAERSGLSPAELVLRALVDHLDGVTAYGRLGDEMAFIKDRLGELTGLVGEALAEPAPGVVAEICRYKALKSNPA